MGQRNLIIIAVAVVLGLFAVWLANSWFSSVEDRQARISDEQELVNLAVARQPLEFGAPLTRDNVRMVAWPANSVPAGAFRSANELIAGSNVAIRPIEAGEPILSSRISDRAVLSANLPDNMRAISVSVNQVTGVAGFVTPGDVVDIFLTRQIPGDGASGDDKMTSVLLENVHVLGVDRRSNDKDTKAEVVRTVTFEVDQYGAQKLTLAAQLGTLTLALRNVKDQAVGATTLVTTSDLAGSGLYIPDRTPAPAAFASADRTTLPASFGAPRRPSGPSMTVFRGTDGTAYEVKRYGN